MFYLYLFAVAALFGGGMYIEYRFHPVDFVVTLAKGGPGR